MFLCKVYPDSSSFIKLVIQDMIFRQGLYHIMENINKWGVSDHVELLRIQNKQTKEKLRLHFCEVDEGHSSLVKNPQKTYR